MRQSWLAGALATGFILTTPGVVLSQIAGRVQNTDGFALEGATVELWDNYPSGAILASGTTGPTGTFSIGAVAGADVDVRVRRVGYYPTVVRDLPQPATNTVMRMVTSPSFVGNPNFCDYYHDASTFLGSLVHPGDIVEVRGQSGTVCGIGNTLQQGGWLAHAFGDDPSTQSVDGPLPGEPMSYRINGLAATLNNPPIMFVPFGSLEAQLSGASQALGVTLVAPLSITATAGNSAILSFDITNTGELAGDFTAVVDVDQAWTLLIQSLKGLSLSLQPGESANLVVEIQVPPGAPDQVVEARTRVSSDVYGPANSGAWTLLFVQAQTEVGDGGGGLLPTSFSLSQNYPNPFNAGTNITFSLDRGGHVDLVICNMLGQTVRTLIGGHREAGTHVETWDGRDDHGNAVSSGIYFSRLVQEDRSQVRKMVLLK